MKTRMLAAMLLLTAIAGGCGGSTASPPDGGSSSSSSGSSSGGPSSSSSSSSGSSSSGASGDSGTCGGTISFDLTVGEPGPVYFGGPQPPWPSQSTCPTWLTITHAGEALILEKGNCNHSCPRFEPSDAGAASLTWDGTYYPISTSSESPGQCEAPACAPAGDYTATFCVAASDGDASLEAPPTCKTVQFAWPPEPANQVISETIPSAADGG